MSVGHPDGKPSEGDDLVLSHTVTLPLPTARVSAIAVEFDDESGRGIREIRPGDKRSVGIPNDELPARLRQPGCVEKAAKSVLFLAPANRLPDTLLRQRSEPPILGNPDRTRVADKTTWAATTPRRSRSSSVSSRSVSLSDGATSSRVRRHVVIGIRPSLVASFGANTFG